MAAQENRVEIVTYLLDNGARANLATGVILLPVCSRCLQPILTFVWYKYPVTDIEHVNCKKIRGKAYFAAGVEQYYCTFKVTLFR